MFLFEFFLWITLFTHIYIVRTLWQSVHLITFWKFRSTFSYTCFDSPFKALQNDTITSSTIRGQDTLLNHTLLKGAKKWLFWSTFDRFSFEYLGFISKQMIYFKSAQRTNLIYVSSKMFRGVLFFSKNLAVVPLRDRSKIKIL